MPVRVEAGAEPIPGYKFIDRLGGGGFGEVWKVEAPGGLLKAIKVVYGDLQTADADGTHRAEQELKALKRVQSVRHPYLLSLERYDIVDGRLLIVMELADRNLWDRFRECRMQNLQGIPRDELLRYMEESAEVLDLMNTTYQLQHLDIKPQNLFLVHNHAKVADFGLVKDLEGMMATVTGGITPVYAAPETFDGVVSRFCDQYSLAIVYQELLTGQRPFSGTSLQQLIMQHLNAQPNLTPLPKEDRPAIGRSLSKKPDERFPSCAALVQALRAAGTVQVPAPSGVPRPPPSPPPTSVRRSELAPTPADGGARAETPATPHPSPPAARLVRAEPRPAPTVDETGPPVQEMSPPRQAPPEITGDGVVFPAVIVGLGQKGLEVLQTLREALFERFGTLQALPNLRTVYIDTDADAVQAAMKEGTVTFGPDEAVLARLNRPTHYLKAGSGRPTIEAWFNPKLLYRIPRNPVTTGMRALGRLAFVDNYRLIAGRLKSELEACTRQDVLTTANRHTRLGLRTNRPRVYVVASLAGGTGSGMFIDAGYVCRFLLRQLGYADPDVVGIFFVPEVDRRPGRTVPLGNTYAALTELAHFTTPDNVFSFRYDDREPKVKDRDPPFSRVVLMPLEPEANPERQGEGARLVGDFLYRDLTTKLGRVADVARVKLQPPDQAPEPDFQTMGLYRFSWPRRTLLHQASRHLCHQIALRWTSKDTAPLREPVRSWLAEELNRQEIEPEQMIATLQKACDDTLGQSPESVFTSLVEPLAPKVKRPPDPDLAAVVDALARMEELVGGPQDTGGAAKETLLNEIMAKAAKGLGLSCGEKLNQLVLCLIDQPDYRLAGAEEALKQLSEMIEEFIEHHESLARELAEQAAEAHARVHLLLGQIRANPGSRRNAPLITELGDAMLLFPRCRYQSLTLWQLIRVSISLRGVLSEQVREVHFIRNRLSELMRAFEGREAQGRSSDPAPGMCLLPSGCRSVADANKRLQESLTPPDIKDLDQRIQAMVAEQYTSLVNACLASGNQIEGLCQAMLQQAEAFAGGRLVGTSVGEMFLTQFANESRALQAIGKAFADTVPELGDSSSEPASEVRILALPPGPAAEQFRGLVQRALPGTELEVTESADDIVFYRELPHVPLAQLKVLGQAGQEAYRQMNSTEHFPPHARADITDWQEVR
jgi:serine/threonine protein kinase